MLLVSFAPLYGNGKIVLGEIPGLLFLVLFLLALNKLEDSGYKNHFWSVWAGLGMGLAIVAKPIFILLLPAVVIWVLWKRKTIRLDAGSALRFFIFFCPIICANFTDLCEDFVLFVYLLIAAR